MSLPNYFVCPAREILHKFLTVYDLHRWPPYFRLHFIAVDPFKHLARWQHMQFIVINNIKLDDYLDFISYCNFNVKNYLNEDWLLKFVDHYYYTLEVQKSRPHLITSFSLRERCLVNGRGDAIDRDINFQYSDYNDVPRGLIQDFFNKLGVDLRLVYMRSTQREASIFVFKEKPDCDNYKGVYYNLNNKYAF